MIFDDDDEERAWVAIVAAYIAKHGNLGWTFEEAAQMADRVIGQLRSRRKKMPHDGPHR